MAATRKRKMASEWGGRGSHTQTCEEEIVNTTFVPGRFRALAVVLFTVVMALAAAPGYHTVKTYKLGGDGGWDYLTVDASARRLYISRSTHVMVVDTDSGKSVGDIGDTPGVHGIALAPDLGR